ncbi:hypothetical protein [Streptomyces stelliscabiei]|uniref:PLL-like beta propeller domain-containing protein n=1 Tax=Streptomyces stelliscabiei TaxID=146820 RepID=A0A8I0PF50_9ACTN|nr:hypothetical protein [Streptomyces stelliscabiei]KND39703.1 hypothetical protein IQ64_36980 [Streptomyces stelliscabiei]MBE1603017.1 hypothetical protein [Streptomyces stelliscabiei]MDX2521665.1 hypothetical protein [Streptomyces stelliscabiei]MDX2557580.1 hypothetical protein [Streptomyces stelliscabiei]MDX2617167.1 hypothetical protein [Streptomyces stelliscabiei]
MAPSTTPGLVWSSQAVALGGGVSLDPAVAPNADDRLSVFVRGLGPDLYVKSQKRDWSWEANWTLVAGTQGTVAGTPVALRGPDGIVNVFWRGPDDRIWALRQSVINSTYDVVTPIASGAASDPAAVLNADGRISVFYNGTDRALWHVDQHDVDYATWDPPQSLAGDTGTNNHLAPAAARSGDGRIQAFVHGHQDEIWGISQQDPDSTSTWTSYFPASAQNAGVVGSPTAATDADQRIRVFWRAGTTGYHAVQPAGYGTTYGTPGTTQGTIVETPVAILAMDGRLEVFVVANDRSLYICEQRQPNSNAFADAERLGGNLPGPGVPVPAKYHDNRIVVLHRGSGGPSIWGFEQIFI